MQNQRWLSMIFFETLLIIVVVSVVLATAERTLKGGHAPPSFSSPGGGKATLPRRLLKVQGREVIPAMSNAIPGEPTCEELRAMWRYYKRQSRAELTNEIPQFGTDIFWDNFVPLSHQPMASFGPLRGRSKARLRMKNPRQSLYGRVLLTPRERDRSGRRRRPMEEVIRTFGMSAGRNAKVGANGTPGQFTKTSGGDDPAAPLEPIVHFSPPPQPTKETSLQKIKDIFREERIKEKGANSGDNKEFGKVVLSPPDGHDGRVANKPKELMTPFEKIRFGHADDILDEGVRPNLDLSKRRILPVSMLKLKPVAQQRRRGPAARAFLRSSRPQSLPDSAFNNNLPEANNQRFRENLDDMIIQSDSEDNFGNFFSPEDGDPNTFTQNNEFPDRSDDGFLPTNQNQMDMSCMAVEGQSCNVNSDCFCVGFGLYRCNFGQCQVLSFFSAVRSDESNGDLQSASMWHSEPLRSSQLGGWEDASAVNSNSKGQKVEEGESKGN